MTRFYNPNFPSSRISSTSSHSSRTISVGSSQSWVPAPINPLHAPQLSPPARTSKWLSKLPAATDFATSPRFSHTSSIFSYLKDVPWVSPTQSISSPVFTKFISSPISTKSISSPVSTNLSADPFIDFSGVHTAAPAPYVPATPPHVVRPYVQPAWLRKHASDDKLEIIDAMIAAREAHAKRQPFKKGWAPSFATLFREDARREAMEAIKAAEALLAAQTQAAEPEIIEPEIIEPEIMEPDSTADESDDDTFDTASLFLDEMDEDNEDTVICDFPEITKGLSIIPVSADVIIRVPGSWPDKETDVSTPLVAGLFGSWRPAIVAVAVSALLWGVSMVV